MLEHNVISTHQVAPFPYGAEKRSMQKDSFGEEREGYFPLSVVGRNWHTNQMYFDSQRAQRYTYDLPPQSQKYRGNWYFQGQNPTCASYAFFNATNALNVALGRDFELILVDHAIRNKGDSVSRIAALIDEHIQYVGIDYINSPSAKYEISNQNSRFTLESIVNIEENRMVVGQEIVERLQDNQVIVCSVTAENFRGYQSEKGHAITVSGYVIDEEGRISLQVLDSASGEHMIPIEHVMASLRPKIPLVSIYT